MYIIDIIFHSKIKYTTGVTCQFEVPCPRQHLKVDSKSKSDTAPSLNAMLKIKYKHHKSLTPQLNKSEQQNARHEIVKY